MESGDCSLPEVTLYSFFSALMPRLRTSHDNFAVAFVQLAIAVPVLGLWGEGKTGSVCLISVTSLGASGPFSFQPADCLFLFLPAFIRWFCVELLILKSPDDAFTLTHAFETLQAFFQAFVLIDEYLSHDSSTI
jgi:hypothetical protein